MQKSVAEQIEQRFIEAVMTETVGSEGSDYVMRDFEKFAKIWHDERKINEGGETDDKKIDLEKKRMEFEKTKAEKNDEIELLRIELEKQKLARNEESERMKIELEKQKFEGERKLEEERIMNERMRIELEREKVNLEREKIKIERERTDNNKKGVWIENGTKVTGFVIGAGLTALAIVADHKGWLVSKLGMAISKTKLFA